MRALLKILNRHKGSTMKRLPRHPRTLMNRYVRSNNLTPLLRQTEEFAYIGLANAFEFLYTERKSLFHTTDTIKMSFNFDGLPTSKSSSQEVWPILMSTDLCPDLVHVIGVYYGQKKPTSHVLLTDLCNELEYVLECGFDIEEGSTVHHKTIALDFVVCDLPAMALVKGIKGPTGYSSCHKCTVWGEYYKSRVTFIPTVHNYMVSQRMALLDEDEMLTENPREPVSFRDHASFHAQTDKEHHNNLPQTPFLLLEGRIDMVSTFTVDGMHTIYIGVLRRFLDFLQHSKKDDLDGDVEDARKQKKKDGKKDGKKSSGRNLITDSQFKKIGDLFGSSKIPREFSRQPKNFEHIDLWKATELRTFLLYGGDIAIACPGGGVPPVLVTAFRCFSMAIRLLSDPETYVRYNRFAQALLVCFVDTSTEYFGKHFVVLIVHILLHLADECMKFGPLDRFSCWKFENALKSLKKRCRNYKTPLKALANQLRYKSTFISKPSREPHYEGSDARLARRSRMCLPSSLLINGVSYRTIFYKNIVLTVDFPDCFFQSQTRQIYRIQEIIKSDAAGGTIYLICQSFDKIDYAYYVPTQEYRVESSQIGIKRLQNLNPNVHIVTLADFAQKCVVRSFNDSLYCYPLMLLS